MCFAFGLPHPVSATEGPALSFAEDNDGNQTSRGSGSFATTVVSEFCWFSRSLLMYRQQRYNNAR